MGIKIEQIVMTKAVADEFLKGNIGNRPVNKRHLATLKRELSAGRWKLNGDTIKRNGTVLIDGQHRCLAVSETGLPMPVIVVSGLSGDVFHTIDEGKRRSSADTLSTLGEKNYALVASAVVFVERYMTNLVGDASRYYTNSEVIELLDKYPAVRESATFIANTGTKRLIAPSIAAGLHFLMSQLNPEQASVFWTDVIRGADLGEQDAVYRLRERLVANTLSKAKLRASYTAALAIKAWNARRAGQPIKILRWSEGEDFPLLA